MILIIGFDPKVQTSFYRLCNLLFLNKQRHLFGKDESFEDTFNDEYMNDLLEIKNNRCLILFDKTKDIIIAFATYSLNGYISTFGVHTDYRRMGIGKYLLKCTLKSMIDDQCYITTLHCAQKNIAAVNLYKSVGYEIMAELQDFYWDDDQYGADAYWMKMSLPKNESNYEVSSDLNATDWNCVNIINGLLTCIERLSI